MKETLGKTIFVEFYGLPGSGKSTVSHQLAKRLRDNGFKVAEPSYEIDHKMSFLRKIRKFILGIYYYIYYRSLYNAVKEIVKNNGYKGTGAFTQTVNIMQKVATYRKCETTQFVIWDQGIVQAAISLSLIGKGKAGCNLRKLLVLLPPLVKTHNVLIDIDEILALQRMSMRSSNDSRIEKTKDEEQKKLLIHRFQEGVASIKKSCFGESVDGTLDIEKEVEQLYLNVIKHYSV